MLCLRGPSSPYPSPSRRRMPRSSDRCFWIVSIEPKVETPEAAIGEARYTEQPPGSTRSCTQLRKSSVSYAELIAMLAGLIPILTQLTHGCPVALSNGHDLP